MDPQLEERREEKRVGESGEKIRVTTLRELLCYPLFCSPLLCSLLFPSEMLHSAYAPFDLRRETPCPLAGRSLVSCPMESTDDERSQVNISEGGV